MLALRVGDAPSSVFHFSLGGKFRTCPQLWPEAIQREHSTNASDTQSSQQTASLTNPEINIHRPGEQHRASRKR